MKKIINFIFYIFSKIYPYKLNRKLQFAKNLIYTMWLRGFVEHLGEHSRICYPCVLDGNGEKNIHIGDNTIIKSNTILGCHTKYKTQQFPNASITIGNNCNIGSYNHITATNKIVIGNGLLTGQFVLISDNAHGGVSKEEALIEPAIRNLCSKGEVVIGNNVWLGDKVAVLSGVHIGNNVIVAANAVVTKDIPDNCIAAGVPAKIIKRIL